MPKSVKPHYRVAALNKGTEEKGCVGAAWINDDGTIAIVLDPFVSLTQHGKQLLITLFPIDGSEPKKERTPPDDEIPF